MKKILTLSALAVLSNVANAQCNPFDYDWGKAVFGVSPDPTLGETFDDGILGQQYDEVVYVLAPSSAGDIVPELGDIQIDSISLDSITIFNGISEVQLSTIGLNLTCNNLDDSPNPCIFLPGNAYCGDISGLPTAAGQFPVKIYVTVYVYIFGQQAVPYPLEGYTLNIIDPNEVHETGSDVAHLIQNNPNPADKSTEIPYYLSSAQNVTMEITDLTGKKVFQQELNGKQGENSVMIDTSTMQEGVYFYALKCADKTYTKRMIVQR
ncbi:MAG: T9SS type A sorting domain-containing protein [Flavobacteriales bacterium]